MSLSVKVGILSLWHKALIFNFESFNNLLCIIDGTFHGYSARVNISF